MKPDFCLIARLGINLIILFSNSDSNVFTETPASEEHIKTSLWIFALFSRIKSFKSFGFMHNKIIPSLIDSILE